MKFLSRFSDLESLISILPLCYTSFILIILRQTNVPNAVSRFWKSLNREQKLSVGLLSVCAFVAITMGAIQMRRNIIYPFTAPVDQLVKIKELFGPTDDEKEAQAKKQDTDFDGLSDWHEENAYHTSPYLADTDSDGIADNTELARRTDPNCAAGQNCGYVYVPPESATVLGQGSASSSQSYAGTMPSTPERSPASIRTYLKAQGVSDAQLANYTDEMLLQAYDQTIKDVQPSASTSTTLDGLSESESAPNSAVQSE